MYSVVDQLNNFNALLKPPIAKAMSMFLKSRGGHQQNVRKEEALAMCKRYVEHEKDFGKFEICDPNDGEYEKKRAHELIMCGVLNSTHAPGLTPMPCPHPSDERWRYIRHDDLTGVAVAYEQMLLNQRLYNASVTQIQKAHNKFVHGRAYDMKVSYTCH